MNLKIKQALQAVNTALVLKSLDTCGKREILKEEQGLVFKASDYLLGDPESPVTWCFRYREYNKDNKKEVNEGKLKAILKALDPAITYGAYVNKVKSLDPIKRSELLKSATKALKDYEYFKKNSDAINKAKAGKVAFVN